MKKDWHPMQRKRKVKDKECQTITWFDCDSELVGTNRIVKKLRCVVCTKYREGIWSRRN